MTEAERMGYEQQISAAIGAQMAPSSLEGISVESLADVKAFFCKNWDTVKSVLSALGTIFPPALIVIGPVIKVGDIAHSIICK